MAKNKTKSPLDGIDTSKIPVLTKEEVKELLEKGRKAAESFGKPKEPGDYDIKLDWGKLRGKKLDRKCGICSAELEHLYHLVNTRPDFIGPGHVRWEFKCTRCSQCGLKYDLSGIE